MAGLGRKVFAAGDVLSAADVDGYLMDQTVQTFATSAARSSAVGTAVSEGMVAYLKATDTNDTANQLDFYNGSAWESVKTSQNNYVANGDFSKWSRGTSIVAAGGTTTLLADRWATYRDGTGATVTVSQQAFTPGTAPVAGYEGASFFRYAQTVAGSGGTTTSLQYKAEDVRIFAGQTVTISYWAKADAARSVYIYTEQNFGTGGSSSVFINTSSVSLTTSWQRFSTTVSIASISGKTIGTNNYFGIGFSLPYNTTQTIDIWGVQAEIGSVASPFRPAGGNAPLDTVTVGSAGFDGVLVATGSATNASGSGVPAWAGYDVAGKNKVINGGFDIWQRGTSATAASNGYFTADRWFFNVSGSFTASQQTTGVPSGSRYCMRVLANGAQVVRSIQFLETSESLKFAGKTVTAQIKIRRNSSLTQAMALAIQKSATVDAGIAATWTTIGSVDILNASMPTGTSSADWYTATLTVSVPNDGTANSLRFYLDSGTIPNGGYYEIAEAQLEAGLVATPFSRAAGTLQGELAACQRYYWRSNSVADNIHGRGSANSTTLNLINIALPVQMRVTPTSLESSNIYTADGVTAFTSGTFTLSTQSTANYVGVAQTTTGLTQYRPYYLANLNSSGYIAFNAEL